MSIPPSPHHDRASVAVPPTGARRPRSLGSLLLLGAFHLVVCGGTVAFIVTHPSQIRVGAGAGPAQVFGQELMGTWLRGRSAMRLEVIPPSPDAATALLRGQLDAAAVRIGRLAEALDMAPTDDWRSELVRRQRFSVLFTTGDGAEDIAWVARRGGERRDVIHGFLADLVRRLDRDQAGLALARIGAGSDPRSEAASLVATLGDGDGHAQGR